VRVKVKGCHSPCSSAIEVLEKLLLAQHGSQVKHSLNLLQFAYHPYVGAHDAVLQCSHSHLDGSGDTVQMPSMTSNFFYFMRSLMEAYQECL